MHDDGVGIGELRDLPGQPIGDQRRLVPVRAVDDLRRAASARIGAELLDLLGALGGLLLDRGGHQLLDRGDQVVESVADIGDQRHLGEHDIAHAPVVDAHVDELRTARHDRARAVVLELVADVDDDVEALRIGQRVEVAAGEIADPERMAFREVGVELAHLRHRHAEQLGELHRLGGGLGLVDLVADHHQRHPGLDQELGGALRRRRGWAARACADRTDPAG